MSSTNLYQPSYWVRALIAVFGALLFAPIKYLAIFHLVTDYNDHIDIAKSWFAGDMTYMPHFLFQLCVIVVKGIWNFASWEWAALLVDMGCYILVLYLLMDIFRSYACATKAFFIAVALLVVWPLILLYPADGKPYLGYLSGNVYHNPTIVLLKPIALLLHLKVIDYFLASEENVSAKSIALLAGLSILSLIAKPNYGIVLLPAVFAFITIYYRDYARVGLLKPVIYGVFIPSVLVLATQFGSYYVFETAWGNNSIAVEPFAVYSMYSGFLFSKFILSIFFPLVLVLSFYKYVKRDRRMVFAWICFSIGAFYSYFLVENGPAKGHGNFGWSGEIALFLLFVESAIFLFSLKIRYPLIRSPFRYKIALSAFVMHIFAGCFAIFYMINYGRNLVD